MDNICHYTPIINLSLRELNKRFETVHKYLCFLASQGGGGTEGANGLSASVGGDIVLGQDVGDAGNPAVLTSSREIPVGEFSLTFAADNSSVEVLAGRINISSSEAVSAPVLNVIDTDTGEGVILTSGGGVASIGAINMLEINATSARMGAPLTLNVGTGSPDSAPLKFVAGINMSIPEIGAMEFDGTNLTFSSVPGARDSILMNRGITSETPTADTTILVNIDNSFYRILAIAGL